MRYFDEKKSIEIDILQIHSVYTRDLDEIQRFCIRDCQERMVFPHEYSFNFIIYSETNEKNVNFVDGHPVVHVSQSFFIWREIRLALEKKNKAQKFSLSHMSIFSESPCNIR